MGNDITVPYSGHIAGGIHVGTDVVISGRVIGHAKRFSINLCVGPTYDQDCALHFNPRFDDGHVTRNHMQGGSWGTEETAGGLPFNRHMGFEVHMKVLPHCYKVTVNNRHFCEFSHRLPFQSVRYVYIEGDVQINYIQFRGGQSHGHHHHVPSGPPAPSYPTGPSYPPAPSFPAAPAYPTAPGYAPAPSFPSAPPAYPGGPAGMAGGPIYSPPVPFTTNIPGMMMPGRIIYITGVPHHNPSRFTVNLQCGPYESDDVAMHFDARFNYGNSRNQVIRTHKAGGSYGNEETHISYFPFFPGTNFEMMILVEANGFKIAVNNQHFTEFFYRIQPVQRVTYLNVVGDLTLTQIRFQ